ncbi:MAG: hypothetical protein M1827_004584 [Pycnora praestabilis]|nr:MAG: hypothetical protein M1827_004584 [Pycnora praestabilis]
MAAFAQAPPAPNSPASIHRNAQQWTPDTPYLSNGACNFRNLSFVGNIPCCGCQRFWAADHERNELGSQRIAWCMCGHHACFHDFENHAIPTGTSATLRRYNATTNPRQPRLKIHQDRSSSPLYPKVAKPSCEETTGIHGGPRLPIATNDGGAHAEDASLPSREQHHLGEKGVGIHSVIFPPIGHLQTNSFALDSQRNDQMNAKIQVTPSQAGLPPIPSQCIFNLSNPGTDEEATFEGDNCGRRDAALQQNRPASSTNSPKLRQKSAGLGLSMLVENAATRSIRSKSPRTSAARIFEKHNAPVEHNRHLQSRIHEALSLNPGAEDSAHCVRPVSNATSTIDMGLPYPQSPSRAFMEHVMEARRSYPSLETHQNYVRLGQPVDEFIQSATEVATPSHAGTPNLRGLDRTLTGVKAWVDDLSREVVKAQAKNSLGHRSFPQTVNNGNDGGCGVADEAVSSISHSTEVLSPSANATRGTPTDPTNAVNPSLHRLLPYLSALVSHVTSYPTLVASLQSHVLRLESLENASFSHGQYDDLQNKVDLIDGRTLDLESKVEDHEKWHVAFDEENANDDHNRSKRKRIDRGAIDGSFASNGSSSANPSFHSTSSSALIATAINKVETVQQVEALKARIEELERLAPPSLSRPLLLEVVVLPWGQQLKGIWFNFDNFPNSSNRGCNSNMEEWTQAQSHASSRQESVQNSDSRGAGWDGESIRRWADRADDWMSPKACAPSSKVYKRLQSRGFVRNVSITGPASGDVQVALQTAFGDLMAYHDSSLVDREGIEYSREEVGHGGYLLQGLQAPFVPLRKIHKDSRLRFLSKPELFTPALWTMEFLNSSVIMRAAGGQKRLFVTHRDAYVQTTSDSSIHWTWQQIRELPRIYPDNTKSQHSNSEVREADAKEAEWEWDARLDPPLSATSSFSSKSTHHSVLSFRPQHSPPPSDDHAQNLGSISKQHPIPISPLSENPPTLQQQHRRIASMPISDPPASTTLVSKRRVASLEISPPTKELSPNKRLRVSESPAPDHSIPSIIWNNTPRRSNPPSPLISDLVGGEGRSQLSGVGNVKRGSTPFAYATPHSGTIVIEPRRGTTETTEVISELATREPQHGEDEVWEGVEEDEGLVRKEDGRKGSDEGKDEEEDEDEGEREEGEIYTDEDADWEE